MKVLQGKRAGKEAILVHNLCDGSTLEDTLHHRAVKSQPCRPKVCQSSVAMPKSLVAEPSRNPTPSQDLLVQAVEFINQYYNSLKTPKTEEHLARVEAVAAEIDATGTYQLTEEELAFGAKHAWRNAARCIGRIQWANLHVFDARKCRTTRDMFRFLCGHMRFATNGGNLRSAITIFPQRLDRKRDFRVWNSQLVRYAGYRMPDGSIRGDPANVEFAELCAQLGWTPRYGRFDVLPLVLQANGGDPEIFEIPPELVLEVPMEHPQYEWFQELQLRWYALPAVSNMLLEMGGLEFPGCPFNGWYMGTEIGVRDLCDSQRYNILEQVGRRMGLEIHNLSSLWKDQALVAINVAVIHSFQKHNVTITDHHSAAESFIRHMQAEFKLRGGCPADWTWLVPPMSGSLTPVFHQEMVNYVLSPYFYYQPDPWLTHVWRDKKRRPRKRNVSFGGVARAALFCSLLMHQAMTARVRSTVLYATETGKSQALAKKLNSMLNCAFSSRVLCMEDYNPGDLEKEDFLAVVTSTFGNGDAPENGKTFRRHLFALKHLRNKFRYCVFGLGSRVYPRFCAFAHEVDAKLEDLGGRRVTPTGEGDELDGQEEAFSAWAGAAFKEACREFGIHNLLTVQLSGTERPTHTWDPSRYRVQPESFTQDRITALSSIHSKAVLPMKLKRRQNLNSSKSSRATILVVLESEGDVEGVRCLPGEHIGVFPGNPARLVTGILKHLLDAPPTNQSLRLEYHFDYGLDGDKSWQTDKHIPACTLSQALTYFLDITAPPVQSLLYKLSQLAGQEGHRQQLLTLARDSKQYCAWKEFHRPTFLDVLEEFPSLAITTTFLLSQLPMLKPRLYSMSSSPDLHPRELHLTVAVVKYQTQDGHGPLHHGVCSTWMNTIKEGDMVPCFIHRSSGFHLPPESSIPAILVGAGSGIAPFRSFWQQRLHDMKIKGVMCAAMTLVFGCQSSNKDHLYSEETLEMKRQGVLKNVLPAYSRQPGQPKVYVQDVLRKQLAGEVVRILHQSSGHLYVCGNVEMVHDVACAVQEILGRELDMSSAQAREYLIQLKTEKRFHEDIFGVTFQK
ncbi:nitric oxide synthase 2b, inducible [Scleropages formosus]|uniref:Nitric oxide synthase n=1 Tax=Scleropages formosus TaxID=113540 RepID=A0A8C9TGL9_SCLFO|nr:nitric oxide synthase, inducible [Scleropages formosus]